MNRMQKRILRNTLLAVVTGLTFGLCATVKAQTPDRDVRTFMRQAERHIGMTRHAWVESQVAIGLKCQVYPDGHTPYCFKAGPGLKVFHSVRFGPKGRVKARVVSVHDIRYCRDVEQALKALYGTPHYQYDNGPRWLLEGRREVALGYHDGLTGCNVFYAARYNR